MAGSDFESLDLRTAGGLIQDTSWRRAETGDQTAVKPLSGPCMKEYE